MKTILFQGDSITDAGRIRTDDASLGAGYAMLASGELEYDYPQQYRIYNRGMGGTRIAHLYARIKLDVINLAPDYMSILMGVNDVYEYGANAEKFYKIYSLIIEEILEALPEVKIMILEPYVLRGSATEDRWEMFRTEIGKRAEKSALIAENYGLLFLPLQEKFDALARLAPIEYWLKDGVHPTLAGHEVIKREWLQGFWSLQ